MATGKPAGKGQFCHRINKNPSHASVVWGKSGVFFLEGFAAYEPGPGPYGPIWARKLQKRRNKFL